MKILKPLLATLFAMFFILLSVFNSSAQNVGINATGATPDPSALLDLNSINKGFLITRVDTTNITSPAFGLMTLSPIDSCLYLFNGNTWMGMGGGGSNCSCNCSTPPSTSTFPCGGTVIPIVDVINPTTGKTWMDRNLGASQVATSSDDAAAYGDLYQWGRCSDGHEKRNSNLTPILSITDDPGHGDFITNALPPQSWRSPQNPNLWQGVSGINNPCPTRYRLPTDVELDLERLSWTSNDAVGAYNSPLKLTVAGNRNNIGELHNANNYGFYWTSSTVSSQMNTPRYLLIQGNNAYMSIIATAMGSSVRCIKD